MPRYRLTLEYDGTPFAGWQRQKHEISVQQVLEEAASHLSDEKVVAAAAGRTDAGVHALGMVAHLDLTRAYAPEKVADALNYHLKPWPVAVLEAAQVNDAFHARFSCVQRQYVYRFIERRVPLVFEAKRLWQRPYQLDVQAMNEAAKALVGRHDFTTFRSVHCQAKSPVKTVESLTVERVGEIIELRCAAPSFLYNQIRSFAGTLEKVGAGRRPVESVARALVAKDRSSCGPVAPPHGLYFVTAEY